MNENIVAIDDKRVPVPVGTLYQWHSKNRYPGLLVKVGGKLFFDLEKWGFIVEKAKEAASGNA